MQTPSDFSITFPRVLRSVDWEDKIEPGNVACVEIIDAREIIRNYFAEMYLGVEYEHQILASWNTARPNQITRENVDNANRIHARLGAPQLQGLLGRDIPQLQSIPLDADLLTTDAYDSFAAKVLADLDDWPRVDAANATKLAYQKRRSFFPILDSFVRRAIGLAWVRGPFLPAYAKLLRQYRTFATAPRNADVLTQLQAWLAESPDIAQGLTLSRVRVLDIIAWGTIHYHDPFR